MDEKDALNTMKCHFIEKLGHAEGAHDLLMRLMASMLTTCTMYGVTEDYMELLMKASKESYKEANREK